MVDPICDRCANETLVTTMSIFNTEMICMDCEEKERNHPKYQYAKESELAAIRSGNYNFPGVGLPDDI